MNSSFIVIIMYIFVNCGVHAYLSHSNGSGWTAALLIDIWTEWWEYGWNLKEGFSFVRIHYIRIHRNTI